MARTKILQLITLGELGGAQKHFLSLVNGLSKVSSDLRLPTHLRSSSSVGQAFDLTVACGGAGELLTKVASPDIKKVLIPELVREISPLKDLQAFIKLHRLIKKERFDIVHTHSSKAGILGRLAAAIARVPIILFTAHGFVFQEPLNPLKKLLYFLLEKLSAFWTTTIITVSHNDARIAGKLISRDRIVTIHNGLDPAPYIAEHRDDNFIKQLGLDPQKPLIGTVANFYPTKGHKYLLQAIAKLNNNNYQFLLIGQGPLEKQLRALAEHLNIKDRMFFLGERTDIPRLLKQLDLFVLSSLKEGFPYVILEAMAAGIPIVSTNVGGIPEMFENTFATLVPPADSKSLAAAIKDVLNDGSKKAAAKEYPVIVQKKFTERAMVERTQALYTRLTADPRQHNA